ncbi:DUF6504 family protein [Desulfosoma caldarium]|uniref:DUF6504 domain-containing protein n=1 Tax=Desulfosoma caldarium TaxID=610254 RepID=A0A3N1VL72_9BACT|nr:DUF6504 family protein [Desulfosoma caldarium]ROR03545.1 hypothetical protein EDC27_0082 [Desulfosoma caldarium]
MQLERIAVTTRDHYAGAQEPAEFLWRGRYYRVVAVEDRWYEGFVASHRVPMRYYRVRVDTGEQFLVRYHELFDSWSLVVGPQEESAP